LQIDFLSAKLGRSAGGSLTSGVLDGFEKHIVGVRHQQFAVWIGAFFKALGTWWVGEPPTVNGNLYTILLVAIRFKFSFLDEFSPK
jgi:hypothetical protein